MEKEFEKEKTWTPQEMEVKDGMKCLKHVNLKQAKTEERTKKIGTAASGVGRRATADPGKGKRLDGKRLIVE